MIVASEIPCDLLRLRPHTRIRIFVIPQLFLCRLKKFHVHTYPTLIWIHSSTQDSSGNIGNRACVVKRTKFASCRMHLRAKERKPGNEVAILNTVFTVKNWAPSCYVTGKNLDLASARFPIHSVFKNFHSAERIQNVVDSYAGFTGYV